MTAGECDDSEGRAAKRRNTGRGGNHNHSTCSGTSNPAESVGVNRRQETLSHSKKGKVRTKKKNRRPRMLKKKDAKGSGKHLHNAQLLQVAGRPRSLGTMLEGYEKGAEQRGRPGKGARRSWQGKAREGTTAWGVGSTAAKPCRNISCFHI